jgi:hypothetical protein
MYIIIRGQIKSFFFLQKKSLKKVIFLGDIKVTKVEKRLKKKEVILKQLEICFFVDIFDKN